MPRDNKSKPTKKELTSRTKKNEEVNRKKKNNETSDSDNDSFIASESEEEMNTHEYRKFLSKIFPSKHLSKVIKAGEKLKGKLDVSDDESDQDEELIKKKTKKTKKNKYSSSEEEWETASEYEEVEEVKKSKSKSKKSKSTKNKKKQISSESEETLGSEDDDDYEDEDYDEVIETTGKKGSNKLNIIFTIGGAEEDEYDDEYSDDEYDSDYDDSDEETENEDSSVSSDSDSDSDYETEEEIVVDKKNKKTTSKKSDNAKKDNVKNDTEEKDLKEDNNSNKEEMLVKLKKMLEDSPNDKSLQKCISIYESEIKAQKAKEAKKVTKHKAKNMRIFRKIIKDKNMMNDYKFYEKLEIEEQKKIIKELKEINKITRIEKPYRMTLLEAEIPTIFKAAAMKKINSLRYMEPGSGEFYKIKNWVDTFMRIPFNKYQSLPISIDDGVEKCHEFMENAKNTLDSAVYGLNDAKMQIMQMFGQLLTNPKSVGSAIAIHGPPGTGKTSLVKEGISKILNRPFAFIALGGATDSSFLEGHSYTYEGSTWGKIVQILIDSKCMNPVIYFDELDKISETPRGEEIAGILTHLTDTSQNSLFHDKYFAEINFDLSKCLFIFSYNDETKVNPILKDRMYRIQTKGYSLKQKTIISNSYLLPKIREQVKFNESEIIIPDVTINHIIDLHCNKEDGVRNLKRCLEIIYTKINLYRLMKPGSNLFEEDMSIKVEFPFTVTKDIVDKLIKSNKENTAWQNMFI
jgi:ATP-dependent Lon protease